MFMECRTELVQEAHSYAPGDDFTLIVPKDWELNKVFLFPEGSEERIRFILGKYCSANLAIRLLLPAEGVVDDAGGKTVMN